MLDEIFSGLGELIAGMFGSAIFWWIVTFIVGIVIGAVIW